MRIQFGKLGKRLAAGAGSVVALLLAALLGIFGTRAAPPLAQFDAGDTVEAGRWKLVARHAWVADRHDVRIALPQGVSVADGRKALIIEVDLTNRSSTSSGAYTQLFDIGDALPAGDPIVILLRDGVGHRMPILHPGLTDRVAFVWILPASQVLPSRLNVRIMGETYKRIDNLYGVSGWYNPAPVGGLTLVVRKPAAGRS